MSQYVVSVGSSFQIQHRSYPDLFVFCVVDLLMGKGTYRRNQCFEPVQEEMARVWIQ